MENPISVQALEFLYSMLLGAGLGLLFDTVRTVTYYLPKKRMISVFFDILFWICAVCALLTFVLTVSGGEMRWYVLFGVFSGAFVYGTSLSKIVFGVLRSSVLILKKVLGIITHPLYLLLRFIWRKGRTLYSDTRSKMCGRALRKRTNKRKAGHNGDEKKKKKQ